MATVLSVGSGSSSSNAFSTGSLSWGTGVGGLVAVVSAWDSGAPTSHTVTGGGVTWVQMHFRNYRSRRGISLFRSTDGSGNNETPTAGALTITSVGGSSTFQEAMWDAVEIAEYDSTSALTGGDVAFVDTGSTSLNSPDIGTITGDDITFMTSACEGGSVAFAVASGTTGITSITGGTNVRSFVTGYSTTDSTPGVTWNTTSVGAAIIALLIPDGADGSHGGGGPTVKPWGYYAQL